MSEKKKRPSKPPKTWLPTPPKKSKSAPPGDMPPALMMEQMMRQMFGGEPMSTEPTAQDLAFQAAGERDPHKAMKLILKAVELDPKCVDALLVLIKLTDDPDSDDYLNHLSHAVAIGEAQLGKRFFEENKGMFWGILETRPYMRARHSLANALMKRGRIADAVAHLQAMIELNPGDNQGIRYELLGHLLELSRLDDAATLVGQYNENSAMWLWGQLLLKFLTDGDGEATRALLQQARGSNKYAESYLCGRKKIPKQLPGYYGLGDENEGIVCAVELKSAWSTHPTATAWLKAQG